MIRNRKGFHSDIAAWAPAAWLPQAQADGQWYASDEPFRLSRYQEHDVEVEIGQITSSRQATAACQSVVEETLRVGKGLLLALDEQGNGTMHGTRQACQGCGYSMPPLDPKLFSYHSARGWCETCRGFGELFHIPDVDRGARADAIEESWFQWQEGKRERCPDCDGAASIPGTLGSSEPRRFSNSLTGPEAMISRITHPLSILFSDDGSRGARTL